MDSKSISGTSASAVDPRNAHYDPTRLGLADVPRELHFEIMSCLSKEEAMVLSKTCKTLKVAVAVNQRFWFGFLEDANHKITRTPYKSGFDYAKVAMDILDNTGDPAGCCRCLSSNKLHVTNVGGIFYNTLCNKHFQEEFTSIFYARSGYPGLAIHPNVHYWLGGKLPNCILRNLVDSDYSRHDYFADKKTKAASRRIHHDLSYSQCLPYFQSILRSFRTHWETNPAFSIYHRYLPVDEISEVMKSHVYLNLGRWRRDMRAQDDSHLAQRVLYECEAARNLLLNRKDMVHPLEEQGVEEDLHNLALELLVDFVGPVDRSWCYCNRKYPDIRCRNQNGHIRYFIDKWFNTQFPGCFQEEDREIQTHCVLCPENSDASANGLPRREIPLHLIQEHGDVFATITHWTWERLDGGYEAFDMES